nr:MAG TPA: hypothetical protein [Caudoviricetes sp.]
MNNCKKNLVGYPICVNVQNIKGEQGEKGDSGAESFANKADFPVVGDENKVYIARDENAVYRYNADDLYYYCIGRDYAEIEFINGGIQNG